MSKVAVTRRLPQPALDLLEECEHVSELRVNPMDRVLERDELEEMVQWCDALLCLLTDTIDAPLMDLNPGLSILANYAVGFNNIDVAAATERGIPVTNTPGVLTETSADLAFALLLAVARRVVEADGLMRSGQFQGWGPMMMLGVDVHGKTLGIVGMGRIGYAVARRARGFDMRVVYHNRSRVDERLERSVDATYLSLDELLRQSDFVTLHPPLSDDTRHLIGERELGLMKSSAFLINTSRGPVVDEAALVSALQQRRIAGAGLDVYEREPEMHAGLAECENAVLLPHIASASVETRTNMALIAARNIVARLAGQPLLTCVNPAVFAGDAAEAPEAK